MSQIADAHECTAQAIPQPLMHALAFTQIHILVIGAYSGWARVA